VSDAAEQRPLGLMVPPVALGVEIPPEPPDVGARALYVAGRLLAGGTAFFFLAFLFAYFYLRSLNVNGMWRPAHVGPERGLGVAIVVCLLASAALAIVAGRQMKREQRAWLGPAGGALALGLVVVALQCIEWATQRFGPADGGYASVFVGWTGFYVLAVIGALYWLETQVATELRARRTPAARDGDIRNPDRLIAPGLDAAVFFWSFLAGLGAVTFVVLYLL
jgi:heme/copper-type cytochrome/quinol oxidase subunit 3